MLVILISELFSYCNSIKLYSEEIKDLLFCLKQLEYIANNFNVSLREGVMRKAQWEKR